MYLLAIDIGATSGKAILGTLSDKKLDVKVIHRFQNNLLRINEKLCWNYKDLFENVIESLRICKANNTIPETMAIDTWGVDFVLLNDEGSLIGDTVSYRDKRTFEAKKNLHSEISEFDLYCKTGIQIQEFNTIYQLKSINDSSDDLERASTLLMTPDYLNYLLSGEKYNEYTNLTTTSLYDTANNRIDEEILSLIGVRKSIFPEMKYPGQYIGRLRSEIEKELGFNLDLYSAISHDTASAVFSNNIKEEMDNVFISSGTWSLVGTVVEKSKINESTFQKNLTNEGYVNNRITLIKNIMGLWLVECLRRENNNPSFDEITSNIKNMNLEQIIDVNDIRFLAPSSMTDEIDNYLVENNLELPETLWERFYIVYNSLAYYYNKAITEIENELGKEFNDIYIMGGGSKAEVLNNLTKKHTCKGLKLGFIEATAIGNLLIQIKGKMQYSFDEISEIRVVEE